MRILNLQNTILVSLLVAGASASAACSSSDATRPNNATGGTSNGTGGTGTGGTGVVGTGGTGVVGTGGSSVVGTGGSSVIGTGGTSVVGTGGTGVVGTGGLPPTGVCSGLGTRPLGPTETFIENFEAVPVAPALINPAWSQFNDLGPPGPDPAPPILDNTLLIKRVAPGAVSTGFSGQYAGSGVNVSTVAPGFGAGVIFNIAIDNVSLYCVDIRNFTGISFYAKSNDPVNNIVNVNFVLPTTNAKAVIVPPATMPMGGGDCLTACYNHPKKALTLTSDWQQYQVAFSEAAGGSALVESVIQQVGWLVPSAAWDFSLDEIAFYSGTTATPGAVTPPAAAGGSGGTGGGP